MREETKHKIAKELWQLLKALGYGLIFGILITLTNVIWVKVVMGETMEFYDYCYEPFLALLWFLGIWCGIRLFLFLFKVSKKGIKWVMKYKEPFNIN